MATIGNINVGVDADLTELKTSVAEAHRLLDALEQRIGRIDKKTSATLNALQHEALATEKKSNEYIRAMADPIVGLTKSQAERIAAAVKKVEQMDCKRPHAFD